MKILDIGANNGEYAKRLCVSKDVFVVAVEPNPYHNPNLQGYNIVWERKAVSDFMGSAPLHIAKHNEINTLNPNWIHQGRFAGLSNNQTIQVETTTIDQLWEKYGGFDHIKIDVEGYENVAIRGMKNYYGCPVQFEWAAEWVELVTKDVLRHLVNLGYSKFNLLWGQNGQHDFDPHNLPTEGMNYEELNNEISRVSATHGNLSWGMVLAR